MNNSCGTCKYGNDTKPNGGKSSSGTTWCSKRNMQMGKSRQMPCYSGIGDFVGGVRQANERMQDNSNLEDYATMNACIYACVIDKEKLEELEKLGWHYLEIGQLMSAFSIFYEIIKTPDPPFSAWSGLITFYEKYDDPASAILNCQTLIHLLTKLGKNVEIQAVKERIEVNYKHLTLKAVTYEGTGEFRFAFNCYRAMIDYSPIINMKAYYGYMRNAIPSGKPEEAFKRITNEPQFKRIVFGDPYCALMYANLLKCIEENPEYL